MPQLAREESNKANAEKRGSSASPVKGVDGKSSGGRNGYVRIDRGLTDNRTVIINCKVTDLACYALTMRVSFQVDGNCMHLSSCRC